MSSRSGNSYVETAILDDDASMIGFASGTVPAEAGAVVTFVGVVRDHDHGRGVTELEYSAHPTAAEVLRDTVMEIVAHHQSALTIRVAHRTGLLAVGQRAFFVEVGAAHRGAAFAACGEIVEEVKRVLPIWKRQGFTDGGEEWVNSP